MAKLLTAGVVVLLALYATGCSKVTITVERADAGAAAHRGRLAGPSGGEPDRRPLRLPGHGARHPAVAHDVVLSVRPPRRAVAHRAEHRLRGWQSERLMAREPVGLKV